MATQNFRMPLPKRRAAGPGDILKKMREKQMIGKSAESDARAGGLDQQVPSLSGGVHAASSSGIISQESGDPTSPPRGMNFGDVVQQMMRRRQSPGRQRKSSDDEERRMRSNQSNAPMYESLNSPKAGSSASRANNEHERIHVSIRVRPLHKDGSKEKLAMRRSSTQNDMFLVDTGEQVMSHQVDHAFFEDATQEDLYNNLGEVGVRDLTAGFNSCIFAYGQTGTGKSYSLMGGEGDQRGLLPRILEKLLTEVPEDGSQPINYGTLHEDGSGAIKHCVCLSMMELYNEKARDLLRPHGFKVSPNLEIKHHPRVGIYVPELSEHVVKSVEDIEEILDFGCKMRVVTSTNMNNISSRSHVVASLSLGRAKHHARLHVIDLAGSEKNASDKERARDHKQQKEKESASINASMRTLALMISTLARRESSAYAEALSVVPYKSHKITFFMKDNLVGNCKTSMLATVSPLKDHIEATLATLKIASAARGISCRPLAGVHHSQTASALQYQIDDCKLKMVKAHSAKLESEILAAQEALARILEILSTEDKKEEQSGVYKNERADELERLGLRTKVVDKECPYLVQLCDDPHLSGRVVHHLQVNRETIIGSDACCTIKIDGLGVQPIMCRLEVVDKKECYIITDKSSETETVPKARARRGSVFKGGAADVFVNHERVDGKRRVRNGDQILLGRARAFQITIPLDPTDAIMPKLKHHAPLDSKPTEALLHRIGVSPEETSLILKQWKLASRLVGEANDITSELRGTEPNQPRFCVKLLCGSHPEEQTLVAIVMEVFVSHDRHAHALLTISKLQNRIEAMRDLYNAVHTRESAWDPAKDPNPWSESWMDESDSRPKALAARKTALAAKDKRHPSHGPSDGKTQKKRKEDSSDHQSRAVPVLGKSLNEILDGHGHVGRLHSPTGSYREPSEEPDVPDTSIKPVSPRAEMHIGTPRKILGSKNWVDAEPADLADDVDKGGKLQSRMAQMENELRELRSKRGGSMSERAARAELEAMTKERDHLRGYLEAAGLSTAQIPKTETFSDFEQWKPLPGVTEGGGVAPGVARLFERVEWMKGEVGKRTTFMNGEVKKLKEDLSHLYGLVDGAGLPVPGTRVMMQGRSPMPMSPGPRGRGETMSSRGGSFSPVPTNTGGHYPSSRSVSPIPGQQMVGVPPVVGSQYGVPPVTYGMSPQGEPSQVVNQNIQMRTPSPMAVQPCTPVPPPAPLLQRPLYLDPNKAGVTQIVGVPQ